MSLKIKNACQALAVLATRLDEEEDFREIFQQSEEVEAQLIAIGLSQAFVAGAIVFERNGAQRIFTALEQINELLDSEEDHDSDDNLDEDEALEEGSE
jgi:hypothetical protein